MGQRGPLGDAARLLLCTSEFLWQEGHTAHATYEEARDFAAHIHRHVYGDFMRDVLAMDFVLGRKTAKEASRAPSTP